MQGMAKLPADTKVTRYVSSPNFSLTRSTDGASYVSGETEPYQQYWLERREQLLFALLGTGNGMSQDDVVDALLRLEPAQDPTFERASIIDSIEQMFTAGILINPEAELSRYDRAIARDYLDHRPFPPEIAKQIVKLADIGPHNPVLDLAAGPGSLALELARHSDQVRTIELSRGFVEASMQEAERLGLKLDAMHESANRLQFHDGLYRAITVSQALHWLDDIAIVKGVIKCLDPGGSFFVVHAALTLPDAHPLAFLLGDSTPLGDKTSIAFAEEVRPLFRRLALLFSALDTGNVARHDPAHARYDLAPINPAGLSLFRQNRMIDAGFARAFLTDSHIANLGVDRETFWRDLEGRIDAAAPQELLGTQEFALLHFQRGAEGVNIDAWQPPQMEILPSPA